jgi:hypothetical protein
VRLIEHADDIGGGGLVGHRLAFALCLVSCCKTEYGSPVLGLSYKWSESLDEGREK